MSAVKIEVGKKCRLILSQESNVAISEDATYLNIFAGWPTKKILGNSRSLTRTLRNLYNECSIICSKSNLSLGGIAPIVNFFIGYWWTGHVEDYVHVNQYERLLSFNLIITPDEKGSQFTGTKSTSSCWKVFSLAAWPPWAIGYPHLQNN